MTQREIKYRFFDRTINRMSQPFGLGILYENITEYFRKYNSQYFLNWKDVITMQYTGCKDINGVDIYEGDYNEDGETVIFCDECHGWQFGGYDIDTKEFYVKCHNCEGNFILTDVIDEFKIKSNIYENK